MNGVRWILATTIGALVALVGCASSSTEPIILYESTLSSVDDILTREGVVVDRDVSHDGQASIRIDAETSTTVRLAEIEPENAENAVLLYRAHLRSEGLTGKAYLEMLCGVPGKGEFFSKAVDSALTGSTDWVSQETPFFLEAGQRAQTVKLNLVVEGAGTVWVDDIALLQAPR